MLPILVHSVVLEGHAILSGTQKKVVPNTAAPEAVCP